MFSKNKNKIFCLSFQRTGTTSVGQFFKDHGYKVAGHHRTRSSEWSALRFIGDYERIFGSKEFSKFEVFEDNPWWELDFYKVLYHRFPKAKFILFERDADKWFDSMLRHSNGKTLGNTFVHSKLFRREIDFYQVYKGIRPYKGLDKVDNLLELSEFHRAHYKELYNLRNKEVQDFFHEFSPSSLFVGRLEDANKWRKLGAFMGITVSNGYDVHSNKSII